MEGVERRGGWGGGQDHRGVREGGGGRVAVGGEGVRAGGVEVK